MTKCARCGQCWRVCPETAIEFQHLLVGQWDEVATLKLIHCRVCGEPLHSTLHEQNLAGQLNSDIEALCPQHRQKQAAARLPLAAAQRIGKKSGGK